MLVNLDKAIIQAISLQSLGQESLVLATNALLTNAFQRGEAVKNMAQFRKPPIRHKQINPETPLPPSLAVDRNTDRLKKQEYLSRLIASLEDTGAQVAISAPAHTRFERDGLEDMPQLFVDGAIWHHIERRTDKVPPRYIYICLANYQNLARYLSIHSPEGFTGIYFFGAQDGTMSIPIWLGHDAMPGVNEAIPVNVAYCIH